jgi:alpha-L-fucosidase
MENNKTLIHNLCDIASKGGNYLLNVGPKPDGTFPEQSVQALKEIGDWMKVNSEAIYATKAGPLEPLPGAVAPKKPKKPLRTEPH